MQKLIIANWKLNPIKVAEAKDLASQINKNPRHKTVLCPPAVFLGLIDYPNIGAQDCFYKAKGPYTGQTSPATLKDMGIKYCIVGHSERRSLGETHERIREKVTALIENNIIPVICVGFGTTQAEDDLAVVDVIQPELQYILTDLDPDRVVVAYEPVWAISNGDPYQTKKIATPEHVEKVALVIKTKFGVPRVLYGGSSNSVNAFGYLSQPHIDGLLVGGASLLPDDFNKIINTEL